MAGKVDHKDAMWLEANFKVSFYQPEDLLAGMWFMNSLYPGTDREFVELYNSELESRQPSLPELFIQYKDYAAWHNAQLASDKISDHKKFWLEKFAGELPILDLASDLPRPKVMTYRGASLYR